MSKRVTTIAAVAAVALAGCGGSSSNSSGNSVSAFKSGFRSQRASFSQIGTDLQKAITTAPSTSNTAIASEFSSLATRTTAAATALRTLKPPAKYSGELSSLASGFDAVAADLKAVATAATNNDASAAKAASSKLVTDASTVHTADLALTHQLGLPVTG